MLFVLQLATKICSNVRVRIDGIFRISRMYRLLPVKQLEDVSEYLGAITSVKFLYDEIGRLVGMIPRIRVRIQEYLRDKRICDIFSCIPTHFRLVTAYETRIVRIRMESDSETLVAFYILCIYGVGFTCSRSAVEDFLKRKIRIPRLFNMGQNIACRIKVWSRIKNIYKILKTIFIWMFRRTYVNKRSFIYIYFIIVS